MCPTRRGLNLLTLLEAYKYEQEEGEQPGRLIAAVWLFDSHCVLLKRTDCTQATAAAA